MSARLTDSQADAVYDFAKAVLHGDEDHQYWLLQAAHCFILGNELPPPNGRSRAEAAEARVIELEAEIEALQAARGGQA